MVDFEEFASVPDSDSQPARMMLLAEEPGTGRLFVNDMRGPLHSVSRDGASVVQYLDLAEPRWGLAIDSSGGERGFQSFAFHPQFNQPGTAGFGKFYTYADTANMAPTPDFDVPPGGRGRHDTVLLEWTARSPEAATYDGGPPRQLLRVRQPFGNHNGGHIAFNPRAVPADADYGLLYVGSADGGSGGDPFGVAQDLGSILGKILRIDPLGTDSANGQYGIPESNPFVGRPDALGEVYAYGLRNPQRMGWDPRYGDLFVADIGQTTVEEISLVTAGANLGWNEWEGSFRYGSPSGTRSISLANPRGDLGVTYPVVEYDHQDPLLGGGVAVTGIVVYRSDAIPQISNLLLFGDFPSGEVFYVQADALPWDGQRAVRRVLFNDGGTTKTLLELIREKNVAQGRRRSTRADLRFGVAGDGEVFILNKRDGTIRRLVGSPQFGSRNYSFSLRENAVGSERPVSLGRVRAVAPGSGGEPDYAVVGGNSVRSKFAFGTQSGLLTYVGHGEDFERGPQLYSLAVTATVEGSVARSALVTVSIVDENEPPRFANDSQLFELAENRPGPVPLGALTASDPESAGPVTYFLKGEESQGFEIDPNTGRLAYIGPGEDFEAGPRHYVLMACATDSDGLSSDAAVIVRITDIEGEGP